ncbi:hypothetical protein Q5H93_24100, partial [Hymenobacter sp. ASUV-10]
MRKKSLLLLLWAYCLPQLGFSQGFAPTATNWALPAGGLVSATGVNQSFTDLYFASSSAYGTGTQVWNTLDLNGDARPDLVVTREKGSSGDAVVFGTGTNRYWKVFLNTGAGYAATATNWALPAGGIVSTNGINQSFPDLSLANSSAYGTGTQVWNTLDLNGDAKPDLVVLREKDSNGNSLVFGTGTNRYWKVFLNTGAGFASTATNWALPVGGIVSTNGINQSFPDLSLANSSAYGTGTQVWNTLDLNGDAKPDLVVLREKDSNG